MQTANAAATAAPRPLGASDYKTLSLAALGGALEFYDFVIFVFFATVLGQLFFPPEIPDWLRQLQTFGIFAAGYLARPLGGIVMAHFGDLLGRKRMFALSILMMSVPTLLMGLLPTYASIGLAAPLMLLALRIVQGAAVGGEVPGAWVFVAEHVPGRNIGFACGTLTAGLSAGILLGSFVATLANTLFTQEELLDYGWRIPFLLGGVFGICSMYLRRWLEETPIFAELKQKKALAAELPLKTVLREHRRGVLQSMLLTWLLSAALVVMILMTPPMLQKSFGFDAVTTLNANSVAVICLVFGCILAGHLADRFGAARTVFLGTFWLAFCSWLLYANLAAHPDWLMPLYALTGFSVGIVGAIPYVMVHAFPAQVRFTGLSFSYNVAYAIFGGLTPILVGLLAKSTPMAPAYYVMAVSVVGMITACSLPRKPAFS
ncbi:MFS transporter [Chitinimonas sp. BJB300]|uniref:MFS transporter n=1 Tax=Chitinimonas sp. BJB300 TaxID=1559339 RepID=UPI000C10B566|nr:MFS transporter [Chitinimonas sp. BJB300]PHV09669.1 MFS transporter [Chitinimonas sp. BJB300]TSJ87363.1 MHS family MFS transporter [Chitinimonas sp. BJB300]